jgi:hypothetical protein
MIPTPSAPLATDRLASHGTVVASRKGDSDATIPAYWSRSGLSAAGISTASAIPGLLGEAVPDRASASTEQRTPKGDGIKPKPKTLQAASAAG